MKLFTFFKGHIGALAITLVLLVGQAYCDLALPNYTSDLVDVGIQQGGVEHPALTRMSEETYRALEVFISPEDLAVFENSYDLGGDGVYALNEYGQGRLSELDDIESLPETIVSQVNSSDEYDMSQIEQARSSGTITDSQIEQVKQQVVDQLGDMEGSIVTQRAIAFARSEYDSLGMDTGAIQMDYLFSKGLQMVVVTLVMVVLSILAGLVASRTAAKIARSLRERLFRTVIAFARDEIERFSAASLITRSTNDIQQVQMVVTMLMRMIMYAPVLCVGGIIMISTTNLSMSWIIGVAIGVVVALVIVLFSLALPKFKIMQKLIDRLNLVTREILTGIPVIRAFGRERFEEDRFEHASADLMKTQLFTNRVMTFMMPVMTLVMNGASVLIVWTAAHQIDMGSMQVGDMIAFITYAMMIIMSFLMICMVSIMLPRAGVAAERITEVLETEPSIIDCENPVDLASVHASLRGEGRSRGTVRFDQVAFRYEGAQEDVLAGIDFTADPGTTTAIIGATGCGKSTLVNLIPRFHDVSAGSVSVDGVDVRSLRQADLHEQMGFVAQKAVLFTGTIESNIKFGGDDITDETMREAADIAQATEFIESREAGFDEPVSQGGSNMSGGQKQRISIARALATKPPILIFDDSFSALDYQTDAKLRRALGEKAKDATVIIVAQRISTVLHADQIIVLEEGRMVGKGTHEELMRTCESYREIAHSQLSEQELQGGVA